jgi:hypothetical protein
MKNLAGVRCDAEVLAELAAAAIPAVPETLPQRNREPVTEWGGALAGWTFRRAWYYWCADGPELPLDVALRLHASHGTVVRAGGDAGCRAPTVDGYPSADSYHIDTAGGLRAFADLLRERGDS